MPAPDNTIVDCGSATPSGRLDEGGAVRNFERAAIAPGRVFALLGKILGGGKGPV